MELGSSWLRSGTERKPLLFVPADEERPLPPPQLHQQTLRFVPELVDTAAVIRNGRVVRTNEPDDPFRGRERVVGDPLAGRNATRRPVGFLRGFSGRAGSCFGCICVLGLLLLIGLGVLVARPTLLIPGETATAGVGVLNLGSVAKFGSTPSPPPDVSTSPTRPLSVKAAVALARPTSSTRLPASRHAGSAGGAGRAFAGRSQMAFSWSTTRTGMR